MRRSPLLLFALLTCSCLSIHSAIQAGAGQFELLSSARPLEDALVSSSTPAYARRLLSEVEGILRFGESKGLSRTHSYGRYVDLHRPAPVWVVSACPELSLTQVTWWFPIAGSFPYLGWFNPRAARDVGADLASDGLDVDVRPARAYSTLGWFDDPLLSSMLVRGPEGLGDLADDLLHESTHATLHLESQAAFNEGLASFAGTSLAAAFLRETRGESARETRAFALAQERRTHAEDELREAAFSLDELYRSARDDDDKRRNKQALLSELQARLGWTRPITNATVAQHRTYRSGARGFPLVLASCAGDWTCFFQKLRTLGPADFSHPQQVEIDGVLEKLASRL